MKKIEVCLSPELINQYALKGKVVVVVDIFRATSCIVTGFANHVESFKAVQEIEEAKALAKDGYLLAGERGGQKVQGFDLGNSPFEYQQDSMKGKKVAISTTNGTQAIVKSREADEILIGAFLNLETVAEYLLQQEKDVIIHCAGWKGSINLEDSLFAGALLDECAEEFTIEGDSSILVHQFFVANHDNLLNVALKSSHAERLRNFGIEKDQEFCLQESVFQVLPRVGKGFEIHC
ncbi:MAG: 2-phosphosulfolactate phosphatase [Bacteroidota bacterium]